MKLQNILFYSCLFFVFPVSGQSIAGDKQNGEWPAYGRDPGGGRYSPLTQINTSNIKNLKLAWTFRTGELKTYEGTRALEKAAFEATPVMIGQTLYFTTPTSRVIAVDAGNHRVGPASAAELAGDEIAGPARLRLGRTVRTEIAVECHGSRHRLRRIVREGVEEAIEILSGELLGLAMQGQPAHRFVIAVAVEGIAAAVIDRAERAVRRDEAVEGADITARTDDIDGRGELRRLGSSGARKRHG